MPYHKENGYIPYSMDEIVDFYRKSVNAEFKTDYNDTTFTGSGFWRAYLASIMRDKEIENAMVDLLTFIKEDIKSLSDTYFQSQKGLTLGLYNALKGLKEIISDLNIYNPGDDLSYQGKVAVAIDYVNKELQDDLNTNEKIASIIVNHIGAGIHTESSGADKSYLGMLDSNHQILSVHWFLSVNVPVFLKLVYKKEIGHAMSSNEDIKEGLIERLESYIFGSVFTPQKYVDRLTFPFFREIDLYYRLKSDDEWKKEEMTPHFTEKFTFSKENILLENGD